MNIDEDKEKAKARLEALSTIERGWYDGTGESISPDCLAFVSKFADTLIDKGCPRPLLFPMIDGGIQAEWNKIESSDGKIWMDVSMYNTQKIDVGYLYLESGKHGDAEYTFADFDELVGYITNFLTVGKNV